MAGAPPEFDWDAANLDKCRKHGVSVREIETLFVGRPRIAPDLRHSRTEDRFIAVGRTEKGRPVFVAFTFREKGGRMLIRAVSARYMHAKEIEAYEKEGA